MRILHSGSKAHETGNSRNPMVCRILMSMWSFEYNRYAIYSYQTLKPVFWTMKPIKGHLALKVDLLEGPLVRRRAVSCKDLELAYKHKAGEESKHS